MVTNTDVRTYISGLSAAELKTLVSELRSDFSLPDSVTFAEEWQLHNSDHSHTVSMNDIDFEALRNGKTVTKTSWEAVGHQHNVTISYTDGVVTVSIEGNHIDNLHSIQNAEDGSDVVTEYIAAV